MMAHYIDAEKLKAEIERRKNQTERRLDNIVPIRRKDTMDEEQLAKIELRDKVDKAYLNGVLITLSDILSFIDSLQQEQPDNEDIDKVAQELYEHLYELKRRNNVPTNLYDKQEIIDLWKAGVEYGYNHPKQEQPEVDLEKEEYSINDKYIVRSLAKVRLEKELAEYLQYWEDDEELGLILTTDAGVIQIELDDIRDLARHFYELGLNARKEE